MIRLAALLVALSGGASAQTDPADMARAAAAQLMSAEGALSTAEGARNRIQALTDVVRAYEEGLGALREALRRIAVREAVLVADLGTQNRDLGELLGALMLMGRVPAPILATHPDGPEGAARAGMLLADMTPALRAEAAALTVDLQELRRLEAQQQEALATLQSGIEGVQEARTALAEALANRAPLPRRFTEDAVGVALLAAGADTLEAFAEGLPATIMDETDTPAPTALGSGLPLPVQGDLLRRFGEADAAGVERPGWVVATAPGALVTAPATATIRYNGPLLDLGTVVVLEPAPDLLLILAGLAEGYGAAGEIVPLGHPVGIVSGAEGQGDAILTAGAEGAGGAGQETLYIELRDKTGPRDPATWFAMDEDQ
ncbi:murein hydrolase activator EnvC family protein [Aestuariibius sp. 2305UL40-4]|uniref:murein hydrolase activator EnvC family protein n=1 Tax=Aestuariibius violaceus TaxID=3234132 RepID=UPI00345E5898